ncbi:hypothetical protein G940_04830 [Escherichia coli UMEA 3203-1]|nr:hypothetical protein G940_05158 [Escherichia coli UMEA 3203-1]EQX93667.1 hypothetical protein G940_04830 [Escherichia coli UMEA 3203-1]
MSTITKERIELFIKYPLENGLTRGEQMELARIALASLEAEPVAWKVTFTQIDREYNTFTGMYSDKAEVERWVRLHKACNFRADITPLYTAKPVPVTPDGWISCSDRMPEETGDIIVVSDGIVMSGISYSRRDGFYIAALEYDDDEPIGGVTHWMPLPEPPQEVK